MLKHEIETTLEKVMKKDHVSHFILRLAFCRTSVIHQMLFLLNNLMKQFFLD